MATTTSPSTIGFAALAVTIIGHLCYRAMLPRPLPGIPYNAKSANRILGDAVDLLKHKAKHGGDLFGHVTKMAEEMEGPVFQVFMQPMGRPWVVVSEPQEAYDIETRRLRDFDRSKLFGQVFKYILPKAHGHMPTGDEWHAHRRLVNDTMSPDFLNTVAGPQMWDTARSMVDLWREKARLAAGRPFSAEEDVFNTVLDIIWAATFGGDIGPNKTRAKLLADLTKLDLSSDMDKSVSFPEPEDPAAFNAIITMIESMSIPINSPTPMLSHWFAFNTRPSLMKARRAKDQLILGKLREAKDKFSGQRHNNNEAPARLKSALDLVVSKEIKIAQQQGRPAELLSQSIQDELWLFILAGGHTTATAFAWAIKYFTANQELQSKFRNILRTGYRRAAEANELPTIEEITGTSIPYLNAVIEECLRIAPVVPATLRKALRDTDILGYHIPKGTDVLFYHNGPGYFTDSKPVDDSKRSQSSQASKNQIPAWNDDPCKFIPERWLNKDGNFNRNAGPFNSFGAGPRACFGRKWALLEFRVLLVFVIWNFELLPTPPALSSYDAVDRLTRCPQQCYTRLKALS